MRTQYTPRDLQILRALCRSPLSTSQLLELSATFPQPFSAPRPLRRRMQALASAGWVHCWQYASTSRGAENYYKVTPAGYRLLNGPKAPLPPRGFFRPVSLGLQEHTRALADFLVCTLVSTHDAGLAIMACHRENDVRLALGSEIQMPDMMLQLRRGDEAFNFFIEVDNATEPIFSHKERESWERKICFYDRFQDSAPHRFRVVVLTTRSDHRHQSILHAASHLVRNPRRHLFYATPLATYLAQQSAVLSPCFLDHVGKAHSLIPVMHRESIAPIYSLDPALAF